MKPEQQVSEQRVSKERLAKYLTEQFEHADATFWLSRKARGEVINIQIAGWFTISIQLPDHVVGWLLEEAGIAIGRISKVMKVDIEKITHWRKLDPEDDIKPVVIADATPEKEPKCNSHA